MRGMVPRVRNVRDGSRNGAKKARDGACNARDGAMDAGNPSPHVLVNRKKAPELHPIKRSIGVKDGA